ncbi:phosphatase PAP2 family protein [Microbacterium sp. GXF6406]
MSRPALFIGGLAAILVAVVLGAWLTTGGPDQPSAVDTAWNQWMTEIRTPGLEGFALVMNRVGGGWMATLLVPGLALGALLIARRWRDAVLVAGTLIVSVALVQLLKSVFGRSRPADMLVASDFGSFPSGHTANAATLAALAIVLFPRIWVVMIAIAWTLAMAFSRAVLSVHWLSDTLGGMLVGVGATMLVAAILLPWVRRARTAEAIEEAA